MAIPWVNFEEMAKRPEPGTAWTFNMARWDGVEPNRRMSMWSIRCSRAPTRMCRRASGNSCSSNKSRPYQI